MPDKLTDADIAKCLRTLADELLPEGPWKIQRFGYDNLEAKVTSPDGSIPIDRTLYPIADLAVFARNHMAATLRELQAARRQLAKVGESGAAKELRELRDLILSSTPVMRMHGPDTVVSLRFSDTEKAHEFYHAIENIGDETAARLREIGASR